MFIGESLGRCSETTSHLPSILRGKRACNYKVLAVQSGRAAIEIVASREPDLILLDSEIPDIDGFKVCRRIREFSTVPIFLLGTLVKDTDVEKGLHASADDYTTKFINNIEEFLIRIQATQRRVELEK
jgi:two-component system KDP operon response regulator KdpE